MNEYPVKFEVDTGCSVTVFSQVEYGKLEVKGKLPKLKPSYVYRPISKCSRNQ